MGGRAHCSSRGEKAVAAARTAEILASQSDLVAPWCVQGAPVLATSLPALSPLRTRSGSLLALCWLKRTGLRDLLDQLRSQAVPRLVDRHCNCGSGRLGMDLAPLGDGLASLLTALLPLLASLFYVHACSCFLRSRFFPSCKHLNGTPPSHKMLLKRVCFPQIRMLPKGSAIMREPTEEPMTVNECRKYLKGRKRVYQESRRAERSRLLTEMEQVTGLHRKSLLRLLHAGSLARKKRTRPRQRTYGIAVEQVILLVWESLDYVCAERLTPVLVETAQHLARFGSVRLSVEGEQQLGQISEATVTHLLRKHRSRKQRLPRKGPERANQFRKEVPMKRIAWDTSEPGHARGGSGASWRGEYRRRIRSYHAAGRCGNGLE